jgi:hypothetical protein
MLQIEKIIAWIVIALHGAQELRARSAVSLIPTQHPSQ